MVDHTCSSKPCRRTQDHHQYSLASLVASVQVQVSVSVLVSVLV
jgi:hypothetical protein